MLTTIDYQDKKVPAIILPDESIESVLDMRDELIEVLGTIATSDEATSNLSAMTLYAIVTLYKVMGNG